MPSAKKIVAIANRICAMSATLRTEEGRYCQRETLPGGFPRSRRLDSKGPSPEQVSKRQKINNLESGWQEWQGSNLRPPVLETGALPIELHS